MNFPVVSNTNPKLKMTMLKNNRLFAGKQEELLPVSKFTLYSLKRDIADFAAFSTAFNEEYVTQTEALINTVENLLEPKAETLILKMMTQTMEQQVIMLNQWLLRVDGYLKLMKRTTGVKPSAFGISSLRRSMGRLDYEGIMRGLKVLISNLQNHQEALESKGMPATLPQTLQELHNSIAENRQKQFEIKSNRAGIVQNNVKTLNALYQRLSDIYIVGKVLYRNTDPAKYLDYTFTALRRKVRNTPANPDSGTTLTGATVQINSISQN